MKKYLNHHSYFIFSKGGPSGPGLVEIIRAELEVTESQIILKERRSRLSEFMVLLLQICCALHFILWGF